MINKFARYQVSLNIDQIFPKLESGLCSCGCGEKLTGRQKKWYSSNCKQKSLIEFYIIKGDSQVIRDLLFERDMGFCRSCGVYDEKWEADHILPVYKGGGGLGLENYQTLCPYCHKNKTKLDRIPNRSYIHTPSFDIIHFPFERLRTFHKNILEDIV
ncbi:HNH endonuclease signature motif containing protein [uncultured Chryseobacterium sp.]|uniref:HNH endonuclease n=1 Tax=uncultured Chryseobacterium sp. TaxID=259322 RepID=UPI00342B6FB2